MKTILIYTGVFTAFQKRSPSTLHNWKRMSHDHSYNNEHDVIVYKVIKDTQSECGQPGHHFQNAPFWSIYTETQPQSFQTKTGSA